MYPGKPKIAAEAQLLRLQLLRSFQCKREKRVETKLQQGSATPLLSMHNAEDAAESLIANPLNSDYSHQSTTMTKLADDDISQGKLLITRSPIPDAA
jgi:hypothetical protein